MSKNDNYTTGIYQIFPTIKIIGIDLSRQTNTNIPEQVDFVGKFGKDDGATIYFIAEKQHKTILNLSLDSLIVTEEYSKQMKLPIIKKF